MPMIPYLHSGLYSDLAYDTICTILKKRYKMVLRGWVSRDYDGNITLNNDFGPWCKRETFSRNFAEDLKLALYSIGFDLSKRGYDIEASIDAPDINRSLKLKHALFLRDWFNCLKEKTLKKRYGEDLYNEMVGTPRDPFTVEKLKLKDSERRKIYNKYTLLIDDLRMQQSEARSWMEKVELDTRLDAVVVARDKELADLERQFDELKIC